jgi:hypothetical protein
MFANTNLGSLSLGFPDVCIVPVGPIPVPTPFPNIAVSATAIPTQYNVLIEGMPVHNLATINPLSNGNEPGVLLGVVSHMIIGPERYLLGSMTVFTGGPPMTRMLDITLQNGLLPNIVGLTLTPSQTTVIVLS